MSRAVRAMAAAFAALLFLAAGPVAAEPKATIEGALDGALRAEIQQTVGDARGPPQSAVDARRRAIEAAADTIALLRSEGYYDAAADPDISASDPPRPIVRVTPGVRFHLKDGVIEWVGPPPAPSAAQGAIRALHLAPAGPGRAADVLAAESRALADLQAAGYADAVLEPRDVVVDHADNSVRPTFRIAAHALVRLGPVRVVTKGRTRAAWVRSLAPWKSGAVYSPQSLAKLERRLVDTGVYESVTVTLGPDASAKGGARAVVVTLAERPRRTLELGAAYSATAGAGFDAASTEGGSSFGAYSTIEGSGIDAKWIHYNLLGRADTLTLTARLYDIQQVLDLQMALPDWRRADQTLTLAATALNERTPAYNDSGGGLRAIAERHWTKTTYVTLGGFLDYVSLQEKNAVNANGVPVGDKVKLFIPTGLAAFAIDRSNDVLNPTRGWRLDARAEPTLITGDRYLAYLKTQAQASAYLPFDTTGDTVLASRLKLGAILGGSIPDVPADRRFYAGGGGSVRGFGYQAVGPRLSDNTPLGGLSLAEASVELRQRLTRQWGLVAFADAGTVGTSAAPNFRDFSAGVGVGVRYDLGFGPFRLDLATPINPRKGDPAVQVYISIGQSF